MRKNRIQLTFGTGVGLVLQNRSSSGIFTQQSSQSGAHFVLVLKTGTKATVSQITTLYSRAERESIPESTSCALKVFHFPTETHSLRPPDGQRPGQHCAGEEAHRQDHRDHLRLLPGPADRRRSPASDHKGLTASPFRLYSTPVECCKTCNM